MSEILVDTRQQAGKHGHVDGWFAAHGVPYHYEKLDFGDYMTDGSNISIDTKKDLDEVADNLGRGHDRFVRECERARAEGYRLIVLVEQHPEFNDRPKIDSWVPYVCRRCSQCDPSVDKCHRYRRRPMQGPTVRKIMAGLEGDCGVRFMFCSKRKSAKTICDLLGVKYDK